AQRGGEPDPQVERCAGRDLGRRDLRRGRGGEPRRLSLHPWRRSDPRARADAGDGALDRPLRAPVPARRAGWTRALPLSRPTHPRAVRARPTFDVMESLFPLGWGHYLAGGLLLGAGMSLLFVST